MSSNENLGFKIRIETDELAENPRELFDHLGIMLCWHRTYILGDKQPRYSPDECEFSEDIIRLPLYLYDHSGITMSTEPFSCRWDSGQVGWIYAQKGAEGLTDKEIIRALKSEVKEYDYYLRGEVYGFAIESPSGEIVDSCWGFYGDLDYCKEEAQASLDYFVEEARVQLMQEQEEEVYG